MKTVKSLKMHELKWIVTSGGSGVTSGKIQMTAACVADKKAVRSRTAVVNLS